MNIRPLFLTFLLALLAACAADTGPPVYHFTCDDGKAITVIHPDPGHARLTIDGRPFQLYQTMAASGIRYATEQGLTPETGLIWWSKDDEAALYEMILDHTAAPEDYPLITRCAEAK